MNSIVVLFNSLSDTIFHVILQKHVSELNTHLSLFIHSCTRKYYFFDSIFQTWFLYLNNNLTHSAPTTIMFYYRYNKIQITRYYAIIFAIRDHWYSYNSRYIRILPSTLHHERKQRIRCDLDLATQDFCLITSGPRWLVPCNCSILLHRPRTTSLLL